MSKKQKYTKIKTKGLKRAVILTIAIFLFASSVLASTSTSDLISVLNGNLNANTNISQETAEYLDSISQEISARQKKIAELNQQSEIYKKNIEKKQQEAASLKKELYLLDNQITLTNLEIFKKEEEIEKIKLEIEQTQKEIEVKKGEIKKQKNEISELMRLLFKKDRKSYLEIALLNENFSDFFNEVKYLNSLEEKVKKNLYKFQEIVHELKVKQEDLEGKRKELDDHKSELLSQKNGLSEQLNYKNLLLEESKNSEEKYQALLEELTEEARRTQAEISSLEKRARAKLAEENGDQYFSEFNGVLSWPVDSHLITCGFHCAGYPFEKLLGPHSGIDIATPQGSPVYAAADGYVAIARKLDWKIDAYGRKRPAYNYINIIHNDELSTVYGHLSQVLVSEGEFVTRGQIIGRSGGLPGTAGAGMFSTGAHLHFEVRKVNENGIPVPVDPMNYF